MKVYVKSVCSYNGHSIGVNGNISIKFKSEYGELPNYIKLVQMLNEDVEIKVTYPNEKPFSLGILKIKGINIDHDGEGQFTFNGITDYVEIDNVNKLPMQGKNEKFIATFLADIELENEEEESWDDNNEDKEEDWE